MPPDGRIISSLPPEFNGQGRDHVVRWRFAAVMQRAGVSSSRNNRKQQTGVDGEPIYSGR